jgi:hypothetical protein
MAPWENEPILSLVAAAQERADRFVASLPVAMSGECLRLPSLGTSRPLLYSGTADEFGEYPVLSVFEDDSVQVDYPGFDLYLASTFGVGTVDRDASEMRAWLQWHREVNCAGLEWPVGETGGEPHDDIPF